MKTKFTAALLSSLVAVSLVAITTQSASAQNAWELYEKNAKYMLKHGMQPLPPATGAYNPYGGNYGYNPYAGVNPYGYNPYNTGYNPYLYGGGSTFPVNWF
jgi:hypothetical protein